MLDQFPTRLERQIDALMQLPWRTSEKVWQRWTFWILAIIPLVLLIMIHNLIGGLLDSAWRTSPMLWQRSCFWIMLVTLLLGVFTILFLVLAIWLPAK